MHVPRYFVASRTGKSCTSDAPQAAWFAYRCVFAYLAMLGKCERVFAVNSHQNQRLLTSQWACLYEASFIQQLDLLLDVNKLVKWKKWSQLVCCDYSVLWTTHSLGLHYPPPRWVRWTIAVYYLLEFVPMGFCSCCGFHLCCSYCVTIFISCYSMRFVRFILFYGKVLR